MFTYLIRSDDLVIYIVSESAIPRIDMQVKFDDGIIFQDSVTSGAYTGQKLIINNVDVGFHNISVKSNLGKANYAYEKFLFFNKTKILIYEDSSEYSAVPRFWSWDKFGDFRPD